MKTRFRNFTKVFAFIMLFLCGLIGFFTLSKINSDNQPVFIGIWVFSIFLILLFLMGILAIIRYGLKIYVDEINKKITFSYPFRFKEYQYSFDEIFGFQYSYLSTKYIDYKCLKFKIVNDKKVFAVSDFETSNIRELEKISLEHLNLKSTNWKNLTKLSKYQEIKESKEFDYEQAKSIRNSLIFPVLLYLFFIGFILKKYYLDQHELVRFHYIFIGVLIFLFFPTVIKLFKTLENIKQLKKER